MSGVLTPRAETAVANAVLPMITEYDALYDSVTQVPIGLSDVSVIILTYNRPNGAWNIIQRLPPGLEIVVVDDGSPVEPYLPAGVKYIPVRPKQGIRAATCRNMGVAATTRSKLIFLDDDIVPHPGLAYGHALALNTYDLSLGLLCQEKFVLHSDERTAIYIHESMLWRFTWSGNMAVRRSTFDAVGGFDEMYNGGHGFEDLDFGQMAMQQTKRFLLNYLAIASHPNEHSLDPENPLTLLNMRRFEQKWGATIYEVQGARPPIDQGSSAAQLGPDLAGAR